MGDRARVITPLLAATAHPTPALVVPRGPSSPEAQRFLPVRVDTSEVLHLEHKDEPHEKDGREQLHGTTATRTSTSSRFHCTCVSSGNPVIYN
jgi:hypothetical protein